MTKCSRCGNQFPETGLASLQPISCPECGTPFVKTSSSQKALGMILRNYFSDVWKIMSHPTEFFHHMPTTGGLGRPLAFALVTHWIGACIEFLWKNALGGALIQHIQHMIRLAGDVFDVDQPGSGAMIVSAGDRLAAWFTGAGPILVDPFLTLFSILLTSAFVFAGARILVPDAVSRKDSAAVTFESAVRVVSFGLTPAILAAIPLLGGFVSSLCIFIVTVIGVKEVYKIGVGRSLVVVLFPKLLMLGVVLTIVAAIAFAFIRFFTAF